MEQDRESRVWKDGFIDERIDDPTRSTSLQISPVKLLVGETKNRFVGPEVLHEFDNARTNGVS